MKNMAVLEFEKPDENNDNKDLSDFGSWYTPDVITYLTYLSKQGELLRYVFFDEDDAEKIFKKQFESIRLIGNSLSQGVTFICKEPGLGKNHFIFGMLIENKLILINPIGETAHKDFYEIVSSIKKDYGLDIYLSNTILQKDSGLTGKAMASCGPISVELIRHISSLSKEKILSLLSSLTKAATKTKNGLEYQEISVEVLLPESLRALSTVDLANYQSSLEALRKQHVGILANDPLIASASLEKQNDFLDKNCLNHPIQVEIKKFTFGNDLLAATAKIKEYLSQEKQIMTKTLKRETTVKPVINTEANSLPNVKKLIQDNALGDDRNLAEHGANPHYWYSVGDGFRLILWLRQKYLDYSGLPMINIGEEYTATRQNKNTIFIADPYYADNFSNYLNDDVNRITATENFASSTPWSHMPTTIIIPLLSGLHWRVIRIEINYQDKTANILFDDPYGAGAFPESLKLAIRPIIKANIKKLIRVQTKEENFTLEDEIPSVEKQINQQGHGENSWDCGPISFKNIEDYIKHILGITAALTYSIPIYTDSQHSKQITEVRVDDIKHYREIIGLPIDHERLDIIKQQLADARQNQYHELSSITLDVSDFSPLQVNMLFDVLENRRLFEARSTAGNYTAEEQEYAYQVVLGESGKSTGGAIPPSESIKNPKKKSKNVTKLKQEESDMKFSSKLIKQLFGKGGTKDKEIMDFALGFYKRLVESNPQRETFDRETFSRSLDAMARLLVGDETCASVAFDGINLLVATNENTHNKDKINCKINFLVKADKYAVDQYNFYPVVYLSINNSLPTRVLIETPATYYYNSRRESFVLTSDSLREINATLSPAQHLLPNLSDFPVGPVITLAKEVPLSSLVEASFSNPNIPVSKDARHNFLKQDIASLGDKGRELDGILLPVSLNSLQRRAETLVEHLSIVCVLASRSDGLDLETITKYKQIIDNHRQRVLMHTLSWECATWFKDKLKPRKYVDSGISQLNDFFNKLNEDFNKYKKANSTNSGLVSLTKDWFEQAKGKISNGSIEAPDYIKEKLEVFSARALRYFVDIEKLTKLFSELAEKGDDPLANLLIDKGRLGQDKDFIKVIDDLANGVHAEMRILYYCLKNGNIPGYIATSLLCCAHCKLVMDAYKIKNISGMHAKMYGNWPIPEFSDMQEFWQKVLGTTLYEKLKALENSTVTLDHKIVRKSEIALQIMENISAFYDVFDWSHEIPLPRLWGEQDMLADQSDDEILSEKNGSVTNSQQGNSLTLESTKATEGEKIMSKRKIPAKSASNKDTSSSVKSIDEIIVSQKLIVLTGPNGTGKTKLLENYVKSLKKEGTRDFFYVKTSDRISKLKSDKHRHESGPPCDDCIKRIVDMIIGNKNSDHPEKDQKSFDLEVANYTRKNNMPDINSISEREKVKVAFEILKPFITKAWITLTPYSYLDSPISFFQKIIDQNLRYMVEASNQMQQISNLKILHNFYFKHLNGNTARFPELLLGEFAQKMGEKEFAKDVVARYLLANDPLYISAYNSINAIVEDLNEGLNRINFQYEFVLDGEKVFYKDKYDSKKESIRLEELAFSSGQGWILGVALWKYAVKKVNGGKTISTIILDEPDRHLDPKLCKQFVEIIKTAFKDITVIMSTHRVDTISLVPDGTIYTLQTEGEGYKLKPIHKLEAMFKMTSNFREMANYHHKVYTESLNDAHFYEGVYNSLRMYCAEVRAEAKKQRPNEQGEYNYNWSIKDYNQELRILSERAQLSFYSVSEVKSSEGGCDKVVTFVQTDLNNIQAALKIKDDIDRMSDDTPEKKHFKSKWIFGEPKLYSSYGIVDNDDGAGQAKLTAKTKNYKTATDNIKVLNKRYSIENFIFDPLILCQVLELKRIELWTNDIRFSEDVSDQDILEVCKNIKKCINSNEYKDLQNYVEQYFDIILGIIFDKAYKLLPKAKENSPKKLELETIVNLLAQDQEKLKEFSYEQGTVIITSATESIIIKYPIEFFKIRGHAIEDYLFSSRKQEQGKPLKGEDIGKQWTNDISLATYHTCLKVIPLDLAQVFFELNYQVIDHVRKTIGKGPMPIPQKDSDATSSKSSLVDQMVETRPNLDGTVNMQSALQEESVQAEKNIEQPKLEKPDLIKEKLSKSISTQLAQDKFKVNHEFRKNEKEEAIQRIGALTELPQVSSPQVFEPIAKVTYSLECCIEGENYYKIQRIGPNGGQATVAKVYYTSDLVSHKDFLEQIKAALIASLNSQKRANLSVDATQRGLNLSELSSMQGIFPSFYEYTMQGINELLRLRLRDNRLDNVVTLPNRYIFSEEHHNMESLLSTINSSMSNERSNRGIILAPVSLNNEHAVGFMFVNQEVSDSNNNVILEDEMHSVHQSIIRTTAYYIDPSNEPIPKGLKEMLQINGYLVEQLTAERQKYTNCGPEVIENFILYLTGERLSQEDTIPLHSKLLEDELTNSQELRIVEIEDKEYTSYEAKENSGTPKAAKEIQVEFSSQVSNDANPVQIDSTQEFSEILMEVTWQQAKKRSNTEVLVIAQGKEVMDSSQQSNIGQDLLKTSMDEEWEKVQKANAKDMVTETMDQVWEDTNNSNANELDKWLAMSKQEDLKAELESTEAVCSQTKVRTAGSMLKLPKITDPKEVVKEVSILTAQSSDRPIEQQPVELKKSQSHIGQQTQVAPSYEAPKVFTGMGETLWKSAVQCLHTLVQVDPYEAPDVMRFALHAGGCAAPTRASHYSLSPELRETLSQNQGGNRHDATQQPALLSFSNLLDEAQFDGQRNAASFELKPLDNTLSDTPLSAFRSMAGGNTNGESWAQQFEMKEVDLSGKDGVS